jgi:hypothetical protein
MVRNGSGPWARAGAASEANQAKAANSSLRVCAASRIARGQSLRLLEPARMVITLQSSAGERKLQQRAMNQGKSRIREGMADLLVNCKELG